MDGAGRSGRGLGSVVTALVTGAGGFIGSWLCKGLIERGQRVVGLDRKLGRGIRDIHLDAGERSPPTTLELLGIETELSSVGCDLTVVDEVECVIAEHQPSIVFHLAAEPIVGAASRAPLEAFETNVKGTWNVLEACRRADVGRVVVASSDKAYGPATRLPYTEDMPLRPAAPYEASKAAADVVARSYAPAYGLAVAVTRFANVYGGGDLNFSRLVPEAVCAALSGRPPVLRSDGSPERDFMHIEDAVAAYFAVADSLADEANHGQAFNAGSGAPRRVADVVELIVTLADVDCEPPISEAGTPEGEIDRQYVDATQLNQATGWRPQVGLEEGLRRTLDWYAAHPEARPTMAAA